MDKHSVSDSDNHNSGVDSPYKQQDRDVASRQSIQIGSPAKSPGKPMDKQALAERQAAIATARHVSLEQSINRLVQKSTRKKILKHQN
jgi:hypothetical protein